MSCSRPAICTKSASRPTVYSVIPTTHGLRRTYITAYGVSVSLGYYNITAIEVRTAVITKIKLGLNKTTSNGEFFPDNDFTEEMHWMLS